MRKVEIVLLVGSLLGFIADCTFYIHPDPFPKIPIQEQKYPYEVGIFIDTKQIEQVYSQSGFCVVGAAHTWNVQIGEGLEKASQRSFKSLFANVKKISSLEEGKGNSINFVFVPSIRNFEISQSISTGFFLKAIIYNRSGDIIYEKEVRGETRGGGPFFTACMCGVFGGESAFSDSVNSAFEDAFEKLFQDIMKTVDFNKIA